MRRWIILVIALHFCMMVAEQPLPAQVLIDGELNDPLWQQVPAVKLAPPEEGVPALMGGEVRKEQLGPVEDAYRSAPSAPDLLTGFLSICRLGAVAAGLSSSQCR